MKEILRVFLKLGFLGFGGPLATISMMEDECVARYKWCTREEFSKAFALVKILPGPIALQMAVYLGRLRGGKWGGLASGLAFILPSFFIILTLGIFLGSLGASQWKDSFVIGMQVSALGVVFQGAWRLAHGNLSQWRGRIVALITFAIVLLRPGLEPLIILFFGFLGIMLALRSQPVMEAASFILLIWISLKAALLTFGSGLAIVPLLEHDVVEKLRWLNHWQFLEALALGQITPGPVTITVTWVAYQVLKFPGAVVATVALFLPGFLFGLFLIPAVNQRWGGSSMLAAFYNFIIPSVVGAMFAVTLRLVKVSATTPISFGILCASLVLVFWKKLPPWIVIPALGVMAMILTKGEALWKF